MEEQYDPRYYVAPATDSTFAGILTRRLPITTGIPAVEPTLDGQQLEELEDAEDIQDAEKKYISIREYARETILNSKIHGLPELLEESNPILRGFLSIIMMINLVLCVYMCWLSISAYLANDVMTTYQIKVQAPIEFPVVQICNLNGFDALKASSYVDELVEDVKPENYVTTMDYVSALNDQLRSKLVRGYASNPELRQTLGFGIDEMLVSCRFQSRNCSADEFLPYFDFYYGMCYRFNQGKRADGTDAGIETVGQQGWPNGLRIELYAGNPDLQEKYMVNKGFKVIVFNKSRIYQDALSSGVEVTTGQVTNLAFIREVSQHMSAPYGNCIDTEDPNDIDWSANQVLSYMFDMFIQDNVYSNSNWTWAWPLTYTQDTCMSICYQRYLYDECECFDVTLPLNEKKLVNKTNCYQTEEDNECMERSKSTFYADHDLLTNCYSNCPKECQRIDFVFSISTSLYPSVWYANQLTSSSSFNKVVNQENLNISYKSNYSALASSTVILNVFYDALFYTQIDETPAMTADLLFGLVGGNIGFFFDASIMSLIETILLLIIVSYQVGSKAIQTILPKKKSDKVVTKGSTRT